MSIQITYCWTVNRAYGTGSKFKSKQGFFYSAETYFNGKHSAMNKRDVKGSRHSENNSPWTEELVGSWIQLNVPVSKSTVHLREYFRRSDIKHVSEPPTLYFDGSNKGCIANKHRYLRLLCLRNKHQITFCRILHMFSISDFPLT